MENEQNGMGRRRYSRIGNFVVFVVIILVFSLFMRPSQVVSFSFGEEAFTVTMDSGFTTTVAWDEIVSYEVRETLDLGTVQEGTDAGKEKSGTWENDEFGVYTLCADVSVKSYLILYLEDGIFVTNFESAEGTQSLGEAIGEVLSDMP